MQFLNKLEMLNQTNMNFQEINEIFVRTRDKNYRMFLGASNTIEKIDKNELIIHSVLDRRFFTKFPRSIDAWCYQISKEASEFVSYVPPRYKVILFSSKSISGTGGINLNTREIQSDKFKHLLDEIKSFDKKNADFIDIKTGEFSMPVIEESHAKNNDKFPIHPSLIPWTNSIDFKI